MLINDDDDEDGEFDDDENDVQFCSGDDGVHLSEMMVSIVSMELL